MSDPIEDFRMAGRRSCSACISPRKGCGNSAQVLGALVPLGMKMEVAPELAVRT